MYLRDFNQKYLMEKKLVIFHSAELFKREIAEFNHDGIPSVNCDGQYILSLAKAMLKAYKLDNEELFSEADSSMKMGIMMAAVLELIRKNKLSYFEEKMIDGGTVRRLLTDINVLRAEGKINEIKGSLDLKFADLSLISDLYVDKLEKMGLYDECKILSELTDLIKSQKVACDYEAVAIYEDALKMLSAKEKEFWNAYTYDIKVEFIERYGSQGKNTPGRQFFKVFGLHNEIHAVIKDVLSKGIPFEQVQIVASSTDGFYPMMTYLQQLDIPYCIPEGISEEYGFSAFTIQSYVNNKANFIIDNDGNVKLSEVFAGLADRLERMASSPNLPQNRADDLLNKASICKRCMNCYDFDANYHMVSCMIHGILLGGNVTDTCDEGGALYIASLGYTEKVFRPYIYLLGFEARSFPGVIIQSPVLLDDDIKSMNLPERYLSKYAQEVLIEHMNRVIESDAKLITVSYVSYDTVNMREQNPSAFYQELKNASGKKEKLFGFGDKDVTTILEAREWIVNS